MPYFLYVCLFTVTAMLFFSLISSFILPAQHYYLDFILILAFFSFINSEPILIDQVKGLMLGIYHPVFIYSLFN